MKDTMDYTPLHTDMCYTHCLRKHRRSVRRTILNLRLSKQIKDNIAWQTIFFVGIDSKCNQDLNDEEYLRCKKANQL